MINCQIDFSSYGDICSPFIIFLHPWIIYLSISYMIPNIGKYYIWQKIYIQIYIYINMCLFLLVNICQFSVLFVIGSIMLFILCALLDILLVLGLCYCLTIFIFISLQFIQQQIPLFFNFQMEQHGRTLAEQPVWRFRAKLSHCQIWEHTILHTIAEAYFIQNYERTHARINRNKEHLVNSLGCIADHRNRRTYLLIERIPNRLSEVVTLNQSQTLKVLYSVFKGLEQLQQIYGFVGINESCICFNESGKVKIWVNPDLSSLNPILQIKDKNINKIIQNIMHIVSIVQRKCFNTCFLKNFGKKLSQHKITNYHSAAQEIVKIGQNMFIDIDQKFIKSSNPYPNQQNYYHQIDNFNNSHKDYSSNKFLKTELQEPKKSKKESLSGHSRKFSNHETNQARQKRFQSFMQAQPQQYYPPQPKASQTGPNMNLNINLNKFTQSQVNDLIRAPIHKSAPLSPRQMNQKTANQSKNLQNKEIGNKIGFYKKPDHKIFTCQPIKQDNSQCDDSFSQNLKVDEKQILMSGEFQTFGILQDLSEKSISKQDHHHSKDFQRKQSQLDIQIMDLEIQKKLQKKNKSKYSKTKQVQKQKTSIKKIPQILHINKSKTSHFNMQLRPQTNCEKMNIQGYKTLINESIFKNKPSAVSNQTHKRQKQNTMAQMVTTMPSTSGTIHSKRQKSPSLAYIDQKYQQYIHHRNQYPPLPKAEHQNYSVSGRHSKHVSNFQVPVHTNFTTNTNSSTNTNPYINSSRVSLHKIGNNGNLYGHSNYANLGTGRSYFSGDYRLPTHR